MSADILVVVYFTGAIITALSVSSQRLTRFYRCTLLWPVFWLMILGVMLEMLAEEVRRG